MKNYLKRIVVAACAGIMLLCGGLALVNLNKAGSLAPVQVSAATGEIGGITYNIYDIPDATTLDSAPIRTAMGTVPVDYPNYFRMTGNINLNSYATWTPIPLLANGNIFDGYDHITNDGSIFAINNLKITAATSTLGLFGNLAGTVKNVTFNNVSVASGTNRGVVAGQVSGASAAKIENVRIESGTIAGSTVGGLVGLVTNSTLEIDHCYNKAAISTAVAQPAGGLVGNISNGKVFLHESYNTAQVACTVNNLKGLVLGGLVGQVQTSTAAYPGKSHAVVIENCYNTGTVSLLNSQGTTGGIIASILNNSTVKITNCANTGSLQGVAGGPTHNGIGPDNTGTTIDPDCSSSTGDTGSTGYDPNPSNTTDKRDEIIAIITGQIQYTITPPTNDGTGFTFDAAGGKVFEGDPYTFTITLKDSHNLSTPVVELAATDNLSSKTTLTTTPSGNVYSYTTADIYENKTILVSGITQNIYTINATPAGATFSYGTTPPSTIAYGSSLAFSVVTGAEYGKTAPTVTLGATTLSGTRVGSTNEFTYSVASITGVYASVNTIALAVAPTINTYTVTLPLSGTGWTADTTVTSTTVSGSKVSTITSGSTYTFSAATAGAGYSQARNFDVKVNGSSIIGTTADNGDGTYTITVTGDTTISVSVDINVYAVTLPSSGTGFTTSGSATATHGQNYTFTIVVGSDYSQRTPAPTISSGTATISNPTPTPVGLSYTYTVTGIASNFTINIPALTINGYGVTIPADGDGFTTDGATTVAHGTDYEFSVTVLASHNQTAPSVSVSGGSASLVGSPSGTTNITYNYKITNVTNALTISVSATRNTYLVTLPSGTGYVANGDATVAHGADYTFTITLLASHNKATNLSVENDEDPLTADDTEDNLDGTITYTYIISDVTGDLTAITVAVDVNEYDITQTAGTGFSYDGGNKATVTHGETFTFKISLLTGYTQTAPSAKVTVDGTDYPLASPTKSGDTYTFTVSGGNVTDDVTITVLGVAPNTYNVTFPTTQTGYVAAPASTFTTTATYDTDYKFTFDLSTGYTNSSSATVTVKIGGITITSPDLSWSGNTCTISGVKITGAIDISVSGVTLNTYAVTPPSTQTGYTFTGAPNATHGQNYTFTITLDTAYSQRTPAPSVSGGTASLVNATPTPVGLVYTYSVTNINAAFSVTCAALAINKYTITIKQILDSDDGEITVKEGLVPILPVEPVQYVLTNIEHGSTSINIDIQPYAAPNKNRVGAIKINDSYIYPDSSFGVGDLYSLAGSVLAGYLTEDLIIEVFLIFEGKAIQEVTLINDTGYTLNAITYPVESGSDYKFTLSLHTGYDRSDFTIVVTDLSDNPISYSYDDVTGYYVVEDVNTDLKIWVEDVTENVYDVTISPAAGAAGQGVDFASFSNVTTKLSATVLHFTGQITFYVELKASHSDTAPTISIGGNIVSLTPSYSSGVYTYILTDITDDADIIVSATMNTYTVSVNATDGTWTMITPGTSPVDYDGTYVFTIKLADSHNQGGWGIVISGSYAGAEGSTELDQYSNATFTISGIKGNLTVTVNTTKNTYGVTFPSSPVGYTTAPATGFTDNKATHGETFTFTVTVLDGYTKSTPSASITVGSTTTSLAAASKTGNDYTFTVTGTYVTGDVTITIGGVTINTYAVTFPSSPVGYTAAPASGFTTTATHNVLYTFEVTVLAAYNNSVPTVRINGSTISADGVTGSTDKTYTYTVSAPNGDMTVTVTGVIINEYSVSFTPTSGPGFTTSGASLITDGTDYEFSITLLASHNKTLPTVNVTGGTAVLQNPSETVTPGSPVTYNYKITNVKNVLTIAISATINNYVVTKPDGDTVYTVTGGGSVNYGSPYTFTVTVNYPYELAVPTVSADGGSTTLTATGVTSTSTSKTYTYTIASVTSDFSISVTTVLNVYNVTIPPSGTGFTTSDAAATVAHQLAGGYTFKVTMDAAYNKTSPTVTETGLGTLSGSKSGDVWTYTIDAAYLTQNLTISVSATRNVYTVTLPASGDGWTTGSASTSVTHGDDFTFYVYLATSHSAAVYPTTFTTSISGASVTQSGTTITIKISGVTDDITIEDTDIVADINKYNVTVSAGSNGSVSPSGTTSVNHGGSLLLTFTPDAGYRVASVTVNGSITYLSSGTETYTVTGITGARTITVAFTALPIYRIYFSANEGIFDVGGTSFETQYTQGYEGLAVSEPSTEPTRVGYIFDGWAENPNGTGVINISGLTYTSETTIYAIWIPEEFNVVVWSVSIASNPVYPIYNDTVTIGTNFNIAVPVVFGTIIKWEVLTPGENGSLETHWIPLGIGDTDTTFSRILDASFIDYADGTVGNRVFTFRPQENSFPVSIITAEITNGSFGTVSVMDGVVETFLKNNTAKSVSLEDETADVPPVPCADITVTIKPNKYYKIVAASVISGITEVDLMSYIDVDGNISGLITITESKYVINVQFAAETFKIVFATDTMGGTNPDAGSGPNGTYLASSVLTDVSLESGSNVVLLSFDSTPIGYSFAGYLIYNPDLGYNDNSFITHYYGGVAVIAVTVDFLDNYLDRTKGINGEILITVQYAVQRSLSVNYSEEGQSAYGDFFVYYENPNGDGYLQVDNPGEANWFDNSTGIIIKIYPNSNCEIDYDAIAVTLGGISSIIADGEITFNLTADANIEISFTTTAYKLIRETWNTNNEVLPNDNDGTLNNLLPTQYADETVFETGTITDHVFVKWVINKNGVPTDLSAILEKGTDYDYDATGKILYLDVTEDLLEYVNSENELVLVAIFGASNKLYISVAVANEAEEGLNGFSVEYWDGAKFTPYTGVSYEFEYGTNVRITPNANPYYRFTGYTGMKGTDDYNETTGVLTFEFQGVRSISLSFESRTFNISITPPSGAKGTFICETESFVIGDTIIISFEASSGFEISKFALTAGGKNIDFTSGDMYYKNGTLTINVTPDWLASWVGSASAFNVNVDVDTTVSKFIIIGASGAGVILVGIAVAILLVMLSIKKKKKDYALARESHKQGMARLKTNVVADLLKEEKGE